MKVTVDFSPLEKLKDQIENLDADSLLSDIAHSSADKIMHRVHVDGLASDGSQIGEYSKEYMKVRTGSYSEPNYTKGKNAGQPRIKYNRSNDRKVILSLTRQMENDRKVYKIPNGYGIGFSNPHNLDKAIWAEGTYGKEIWGLSEEESSNIDDIINQKLEELLG